MRRFLPLLLLLAACAAPLAPSDATPIQPQAIYWTWWAEMETCSQRQGDIDRVRWYAVPDGGFSTQENTKILGVWRSPHNIYLIDYGLDNRHLVAHEMLHDLTQSTAHGAIFDTCGVR